MSGKVVPSFSKSEQRLLDSLNTPEKIQNFIDQKITYDPDREDRSVKEVITDRMGECYNGALFATACLQNQGIKSSVLEILARRDEEHILSVYQKNGLWGSIAQSKYQGLKGRNPMYKTVRDLVVSYMELYFSFEGHYSLASFTNPINLKKYKNKWLWDSVTVVKIGKDLRNLKHIKLVDDKAPFYYVSPDRYWSEVLFIPKGTKIPKKYLAHKPKKFK